SASPLIIFTFFFFQAEDGIRDGHVTGVQTCALPISPQPTIPTRAGVFTRPPRASARARRASAVRHRARVRRSRPARRAATRRRRSEERRVGKECRSRWSPYE